MTIQAYGTWLFGVGLRRLLMTPPACRDGESAEQRPDDDGSGFGDSCLHAHVIQVEICGDFTPRELEGCGRTGGYLGECIMGVVKEIGGNER